MNHPQSAVKACGVVHRLWARTHGMAGDLDRGLAATPGSDAPNPPFEGWNRTHPPLSWPLRPMPYSTSGGSRKSTIPWSPIAPNAPRLWRWPRTRAWSTPPSCRRAWKL